MLLIRDAGTSNSLFTSASRIDKLGMSVDYVEDEKATPVVSIEDMSGYELLYAHKQDVSNTGDQWWIQHNGYLTILRDEATNEFSLQCFVVQDESGEIAVVSMERDLLPQMTQKPDVIAAPLDEPQEYVFYSVGKNLYLIDRLNGNAITLYYTFDSNVTAMNYMYRENAHLTVGLEDGTFFVLGVNDAKNTSMEHRLIYKSETKVGKIIDIKRKLNNDGLW